MKDSNRRGEYHNARLRTVAEELGLQADSRDPRFGWSLKTLAASAEALYAPTITELARALAHERPPADEVTAVTVLACRCGARGRKGRGVICGVCARRRTSKPRSSPPPGPARRVA